MGAGNIPDARKLPSKESGITAANGLLYRNGVELDVFEADDVANEHGWVYAEQLVAAMSAPKGKREW